MNLNLQLRFLIAGERMIDARLLAYALPVTAPMA